MSVWKRATGQEVLGPLEREVMEIVWDAGGPMSVREVLGRLNDQRDDDLAYTTVMTTLARLADKGLLRREKDGRSYLYEPTGDGPAAVAVRTVIERFGEAALAEFVDEANADPQLRERLRRLMNDEA